MRRRWVGRLTAAALGGALASCSPGSGAAPGPIVADLATELSVAEVRQEPGLLDLGTPGARPHLRSGWYWDQRTESGGTLVWSQGESSAVELFLERPRDLPLALACKPFHYAGTPPQGMAVEINGRELGWIDLVPGDHVYSLTLPAEGLAAGVNRLAFHYRWSRIPAEIGASNDPRRLAVAWDWIRFGEEPGEGSGGGEVRADPGAGLLHLPAGAQVDYFVELPAGSVLTVERVALAGPGRLEATLMRDGGGEESLAEIDAAHRDLRVALGRQGGLARLRLHSVLPPDPGAPTSVTLVGAVIREPSAAGARGEPSGSESAAAASGPGPEREATPSHSNVVLYLVDTLRADRLGCYGEPRPVSPRLDAFAAEAVLFEDALSQSSWTKASMASVLTGLIPSAHGVNGPRDRLPEDLPTLTRILHRAGYRTAAVVANSFVTEPFGFAEGFDHFVYLPDLARSREVMDRVEAWLEAAAGDGRPFFLYVHSIDPHAPYDPPPDLRRRFAPRVEDPEAGSVAALYELVRGAPPAPETAGDLGALYAAEIAAEDRQLGRFLDLLQGRGLYDDSLILFTSDHGEAFSEHGSWSHGQTLYAEVLRVPLLLRLPGGEGAGRRIPAPVQGVDLLPTVLDSVGLPPPPRLARASCP